MNITHIKMNAAAGENFCGYSLVRRIAGGCLIAVAVMSSALANPNDADRNGPRDAYRAERAQQQRQYEERQRNQDARAYEQRAEDQRRQQDAQGESSRRGGRLTPDERRDLRRQINEAGMDIYPNRRRR